ncbi:hypothetical protein [Streptomyces sp. RKAG337]|uniref:hypothetical protein n=1 Tax=Streptomyces sp. RKAG337 TaxID=2893404 RepID=UPI0020344FF4|nr:hypothetical protein [Streptomyces sp. RKAG337]MCM2425455.1 hypothetical protein [Streptomyces sp. RKAG337]
MQEWPEGPAAEPQAARERYDTDVQLARKQAREALRADFPAAHVGLGAVLLVSAIMGLLTEPAMGVLVAGSFATLFAVTLAVMVLRGARGANALRRTYLVTFGWGNWL